MTLTADPFLEVCFKIRWAVPTPANDPPRMSMVFISAVGM